MSWENVFYYIENIIRMITLIEPIIKFIEDLFKRLFPGEEKGGEKKLLVMKIAKILAPPDMPEEIISIAIDEIVKEKNKAGEFFHHKEGNDLQISGP